MSASVLDKYEPVIGLECHVQLATKAKIFSASTAAFGGEPNTATDPVVLALPGCLPVLNGAVVAMAVRFGLAVGGHIRPRCRFARKHYFYADLPKGYQISQYDEPIIEGGAITFRLHGETRKVRLTRIHLEEDAGKNVHSPSGVSLVDYNRAGVPLCEMVSEPDVRSAEEASEFLRAVRTLVRYLGISDGNMEEGSLRCDANVSIRPRGESKLGTKAELKNINSFKNVKDAIEHEIKRQAQVLDRGERVVQETRLWDAARGHSASMRSKEQAHDYRYFPEPDLPPVVVSEAFIAETRAAMPELPEDRYDRYVKSGLAVTDVSVLVSEKEISDYYDAAVKAGGAAHAKKLAHWLLNELLARVSDVRALADANLPVPPAALAELVELVENGTISGKQGKEIFGRMWEERRRAGDIVKAEGLAQVSDTGALEAACRKVIEAHPDEVARYKGGDAKLIGFFVGRVIKESGGKANPKSVNEILRKLLG
jgi:aspartyl-tRNA(Asn)/glutamyl-tRNA(Gln) amidotransferase subunit B